MNKNMIDQARCPRPFRNTTPTQNPHRPTGQHQIDKERDQREPKRIKVEPEEDESEQRHRHDPDGKPRQCCS